MKIIKLLIKIIFSISFIAFSMLITLYLCTKFSRPISIANKYSYVYLDNNNDIINENVDSINLGDISPYLINAIISVEDKNFYKHHGFDYLRIIKTLYKNTISKKITGGASTISQQLVKNKYLDFEKTYKRKIKEALLTINIETHYSKDEILTSYLNTVNFGSGNYGIKNAALYYFNKNASDLTLEESIIIAGIPKNPTNYNPLYNMDNAKKRANLIAQLMYKNNYISKSELDNLDFDGVIFSDNVENEANTTLPYFIDAVNNELKNINIFPNSILESELRIYTTLDSDSEKNLEKTIKKNLIDSKMEVASILVDPNNGEVLALAGGKDYNYSQYNRVLSAKRQVGSTIKPLLYYCALNNGMVSSSTFLSEYTNFTFANNKTYSPKNFNDKYANKEITMAAALSYSDNIYAVKTHLFLGEETLVNYAKKIGIKSNLEPNPSLALGTNEINMYEYANAYLTLASGGFKNKLHFIKKIEDKDGNLLYEYKDYQELINNPNIVYILNELLTSTYNINFKDYNNPTVLGMASKLKNKYAIKTGTTDTDFWLVGYNKNALMMVWNGYDNNKYIDVGDYQISRNIWLDTIESYEEKTTDNWYSKPDNVVAVPKNAITGSDEFNKDNYYNFYYVNGTQ
ncbi:MAG: transglycosylase domain-containing protein [Bacilli bacterium]|nr:transglycosylase domain-containing protein [Bacilli bacterium]